MYIRFSSTIMKGFAMHRPQFRTTECVSRPHANEDVEMDAESETDYPIEVVHNHVYFYNPVTVKTMLDLCKRLRSMESGLLAMQHDFTLPKPPAIYLHLQSNGGDAYAGLSAMNTIENLRVPVITVVDGFVASAATFLLFAGTERWMQKNSCLLIHQIRTEFWGRYEELKDDMKNSSLLMDDISRIYSEKSNIPEKKLKRILKRELHLNTETCSKYGIVHKVI